MSLLLATTSGNVIIPTDVIKILEKNQSTFSGNTINFSADTKISGNSSTAVNGSTNIGVNLPTISASTSNIYNLAISSSTNIASIPPSVATISSLSISSSTNIVSIPPSVATIYSLTANISALLEKNTFISSSSILQDIAIGIPTISSIPVLNVGNMGNIVEIIDFKNSFSATYGNFTKQVVNDITKVFDSNASFLGTISNISGNISMDLSAIPSAIVKANPIYSSISIDNINSNNPAAIGSAGSVSISTQIKINSISGIATSGILPIGIPLSGNSATFSANNVGIQSSTNISSITMVNGIVGNFGEIADISISGTKSTFVDSNKFGISTSEPLTGGLFSGTNGSVTSSNNATNIQISGQSTTSNVPASLSYTADTNYTISGALFTVGIQNISPTQIRDLSGILFNTNYTNTNYISFPLNILSPCIFSMVSRRDNITDIQINGNSAICKVVNPNVNISYVGTSASTTANIVNPTAAQSIDININAAANVGVSTFPNYICTADITGSRVATKYYTFPSGLVGNNFVANNGTSQPSISYILSGNSSTITTGNVNIGLVCNNNSASMSIGNIASNIKLNISGNTSIINYNNFLGDLKGIPTTCSIGTLLENISIGINDIVYVDTTYMNQIYIMPHIASLKNNELLNIKSTQLSSNNSYISIPAKIDANTSTVLNGNNISINIGKFNIEKSISGVSSTTNTGFFRSYSNTTYAILGNPAVFSTHDLDFGFTFKLAFSYNSTTPDIKIPLYGNLVSTKTAEIIKEYKIILDRININNGTITQNITYSLKPNTAQCSINNISTSVPIVGNIISSNFGAVSRGIELKGNIIQYRMVGIDQIISYNLSSNIAYTTTNDMYIGFGIKGNTFNTKNNNFSIDSNIELVGNYFYANTNDIVPTLKPKKIVSRVGILSYTKNISLYELFYADNNYAVPEYAYSNINNKVITNIGYLNKIFDKAIYNTYYSESEYAVSDYSSTPKVIINSKIGTLYNNISYELNGHIIYSNVDNLSENIKISSSKYNIPRISSSVGDIYCEYNSEITGTPSTLFSGDVHTRISYICDPQTTIFNSDISLPISSEIELKGNSISFKYRSKVMPYISFGIDNTNVIYTNTGGVYESIVLHKNISVLYSGILTKYIYNLNAENIVYAYFDENSINVKFDKDTDINSTFDKNIELFPMFDISTEHSAVFDKEINLNAKFI